MAHEKIDYIIEELRPALFDICTGLFETLGCMSPSPELKTEKAKEILKKMNTQGSRVFVAIGTDKKILASITLMIEHKLIRGGSKAAHIEDVVTHTFARGQGIARALIEQAISMAKEEGCYKIVLDSCHALKEFYEKRGFKENGPFMRMDL